MCSAFNWNVFAQSNDIVVPHFMYCHFIWAQKGSSQFRGTYMRKRWLCLLNFTSFGQSDEITQAHYSAPETRWVVNTLSFAASTCAICVWTREWGECVGWCIKWGAPFVCAYTFPCKYCATWNATICSVSQGSCMWNMSIWKQATEETVRSDVLFVLVVTLISLQPTHQ